MRLCVAARARSPTARTRRMRESVERESSSSCWYWPDWTAATPAVQCSTNCMSFSPFLWYNESIIFTLNTFA